MPLSTVQASYIVKNDVGCRSGIDLDGAAYAFSDITGEGKDGNDPIIPVTMYRWIATPEHSDFHPRWDNRLWNTCGIIINFKSEGTLLLVSKAAPTAERYIFSDDQAQGDQYSFRKCNKLPQNSQILTTIKYDRPKISDLYKIILDALAKLAGG